MQMGTFVRNADDSDNIFYTCMTTSYIAIYLFCPNKTVFDNSVACLLVVFKLLHHLIPPFTLL